MRTWERKLNLIVVDNPFVNLSFHISRKTEFGDRNPQIKPITPNRAQKQRPAEMAGLTPLQVGADHPYCLNIT